MIFVSDEDQRSKRSVDFTIGIGTTPIFSNFDLYLNTGYAAHYVYFTFII